MLDCRRRHRQELSNEAGNPHGMNAAKKSQRAAVLCDWLIATFGRYLAATISLNSHSCLGAKGTAHCCCCSTSCCNHCTDAPVTYCYQVSHVPVLALPPILGCQHMRYYMFNLCFVCLTLLQMRTKKMLSIHSTPMDCCAVTSMAISTRPISVSVPGCMLKSSQS